MRLLGCGVSYRDVFVLLTAGHLWSGGDMEDGQLGHGSMFDVFARLDSKGRCIRVCAGCVWAEGLVAADDGRPDDPVHHGARATRFAAPCWSSYCQTYSGAWVVWQLTTARTTSIPAQEGEHVHDLCPPVTGRGRVRFTRAKASG